jgi:hypothetical protein
MMSVSEAPGTPNRATMLAAALAHHEGHRIARVVIDKALKGDAVAARFVIGHLTPRPRGRPIALEIPDGARAGDIVAAFNATLLAMAAGEITPDEALTITRVFDGRLKALKAWEMERHLTRWDPIPGDEMFYAHGEEDYEEEDEGGGGDEDDEDEDRDGDGSATAFMEPSPPGRGQGEGVPPANGLHPGDDPHPDPLPGGEGVGVATALTEPSPSARGQGEGASPANDLHPGDGPHPDALPAGEGVGAAAAPTPPPASEPPPVPLHSACIQPSPATIAGRRRVAELVRRQWARELS